MRDITDALETRSPDPDFVLRTRSQLSAAWNDGEVAAGKLTGTRANSNKPAPSRRWLVAFAAACLLVLGTAALTLRNHDTDTAATAPTDVPAITVVTVTVVPTTLVLAEVDPSTTLATAPPNPSTTLTEPRSDSPTVVAATEKPVTKPPTRRSTANVSTGNGAGSMIGATDSVPSDGAVDPDDGVYAPPPPGDPLPPAMCLWCPPSPEPPVTTSTSVPTDSVSTSTSVPDPPSSTSTSSPDVAPPTSIPVPPPATSTTLPTNSVVPPTTVVGSSTTSTAVP